MKDPIIKLFGMKIPFPGEANSSDKVTSELSEKNNYSLHSSHDSKPETIDKEDTTSTDQIENSGKNLKKPTKIQPCPRCKSMDTKFCYYNNYNINQPRHFCKACQRYWTAGGTMRNVPVGAGRRKNKSSSSHYHHITISEALEAARLDPSLQANTRILSFGLEAHQKHEVSNGDNCSSGSSVTTSVDKSEPQMNNMNGYPCIPGFPWPYMWNPAMPPPGFYPGGGIPGFPGYPMPFYPYCPIPMLSHHQSSSPMTQKGSNPNPPTLGKHSRDEETARKDNEKERKQRNGCVLVPKMLRIDDPNEAAKSSIWTTLGIKNEGTSKVGMFEGFHQKTKNDKAKSSSLLSANPAALSRSLNFHERI